MKNRLIIVLIVIFCFFHLFCGYGQIRKVYTNIESKNVLYYKVEEIVNMAFGGSTTRYTVSDLSLISKVDLGPDNIRIISPVYKEENYRKKYYIETKNINTDKNREPTNLLEISIESGKILIPENPPIEQHALALVVSKLVKVEIPPIDHKPEVGIKQTTKVVPVEAPKEKKDYVLVNVAIVYERVLEKGYKSVFMFKVVADYYYFKNQMEKAAKWYNELFAMTNELEPIYYFRFGDALRKAGKVDEGNSMVEKFNKMVD